MAEITAGDFEAWQASTTVIDEAAEGIRFVALFTWHQAKLQFAREAPRVIATLIR